MVPRNLAYILLGIAILGVIVGALYVLEPKPAESEAGQRSFEPWSWIDRTSEAKLLFVGDMMFDRFVRSTVEEKGYESIFSNIREFLTSYDFVMGNLEGPVTLYPSISAGTKPGDVTNMVFTFSNAGPQALRVAGFDMVSIANNHILDFGPQGYAETARSLDEEGVVWLGNPYERDGNIRYVTYDGIIIGLVAFNQFLGRGLAATLEDIHEADLHADSVIVFAHWGEEYATSSPVYVQAWAHAFVDSGAALVVGAHPHVVQSFEDYNGTRIYYSLGNFIFDQYWNRSVRCGMALDVLLKKKNGALSYEFRQYPTGFTKEGEVVLYCE